MTEDHMTPGSAPSQPPTRPYAIPARTVREAEAEALLQRLQTRPAMRLCEVPERAANDLARDGRAVLLAANGRTWIVLPRAVAELRERGA